MVNAHGKTDIKMTGAMQLSVAPWSGFKPSGLRCKVHIIEVLLSTMGEWSTNEGIGCPTSTINTNLSEIRNLDRGQGNVPDAND